MLFPPDLRDWLPENHLAHFILDAVAMLPLQGFRVNLRGSGSDQYPPSMMLSLLIYCYPTGRMGSRQIEAATYTDVAVRYICGGSAHPDHDTICAFRRENGAVFEESFVKALAYAQELGVLKKRGGVSVDGTKVQANASKHAAVGKDGHHRTVADLISQADPPAPTAGGSVTETMRHRLRTAAGKAKYALRKQTVELVFGIIKAVMGFRRFLLRGKVKVSLEWTLVTLAYNFKRLFRLVQRTSVAGVGWQAKLAA